MNPIIVRNIKIGEGAPKICVPIVSTTKEEIISEAKALKAMPVDIVEWRVDCFEGVLEIEKVKEALEELREVLRDIPILFTFRTSKEGGEKAIELDKYTELNEAVAATGLADLIDAETKEQQKYALKQMNGDLKDLYEGWRTDLINVLAHLEAYIDFPNEELPQNIVSNLENTVFKIKEAIHKHLTQSDYGEKLRDGFNVVILGEPNAGKSTLLNTLAQREAVIVSDIAGTTRDAVDIYMDIGGYPVIFTDTAGLRDTDEQIEKKGIEIAFSKAKEADLIIALVDGKNINLKQFENNLTDCKNDIIYVLNKSDYLSEEQCIKYKNDGYILISAKFKQGVDELIDTIKEHISNNFNQSSTALITRKRYREVLNDVFKNLEDFTLSKNIELAAEDIRLAVRNIGKITGRVEVNEILDKIFGSFCIGK